MPYASLDNLSRFHGRMRGRASSEFASLGMANWQKTAVAGAVSFLPVPEMPLDPVVNFLFSETGPASGTKSPDNPSTITGVTQAKVTRCGKNIIRAHATGSQTISGVTFTVGEDGSVTANGTASENAIFYYAPSGAKVQLKAGCQYTLSGCSAGGSNSTYYIRDTALQVSDFGDGATATASVSGFASIRIVVMSGTTVSNLVFKPQLELGSAATSFEPYEGADYTIPLNGTFYGGSVDLSTGVMTVTWDSFIFDGTEGWQSANTYLLSDTAGFYLGNSQLVALGMSCASGLNPIACPMFPLDASFVVNTQNIYKSDNGSLMIRVENSSLSSYGYVYGVSTLAESVASFKGWLSDNNVIVFYKRATPYTVQLSPQQILSLSQPDPYVPRINTVYSDQVSVQAGYPKSPQATQNELTNAVVSLGGNV